MSDIDWSPSVKSETPVIRGAPLETIMEAPQRGGNPDKKGDGDRKVDATSNSVGEKEGHESGMPADDLGGTVAGDDGSRIAAGDGG
jgi:hypothetical protein